jgi:hypothetical protein
MTISIVDHFNAYGRSQVPEPVRGGAGLSGLLIAWASSSLAAVGCL